MLFSPSSSTNPERRSVILHSYSTQNQQRPYQKLSEKWLLITSLSGCSLEQKLPSSVTHSPDRTRPGTPFLTSAIPGLRSALECRNLISSNSFAHRLGTRNSALRLAPGPVGLKPELRQWRSEFVYKIYYGTVYQKNNESQLCTRLSIWLLSLLIRSTQGGVIPKISGPQGWGLVILGMPPTEAAT
jgi:hypothetical protein